MTRKLAAVATLLVFSLSLVFQNSAYVTLIERQLKLCRSNSNEDDTRVRRWGWWGQKPSERQCSSYRSILCKSQIAPGLEVKVPTIPPSLPSLPPLPPSLPPPEALPKSGKRRSSSTVRKDFETVNNKVKK